MLEISVNLQFVKSKKYNHRIDKRHCMLHLHTHATLYSVCRLVVPSGNEKLLDICLADVSFFLVLENPESVCRAKRMEMLNERNDTFKKTAILSFKIMRNGNSGSNVYRSFLSAVIRTLNPLGKQIGAL